MLNSWTCPQASHTHDAISEAAQLMKEAVDDIMVTLNEAASEGGMVGGMVESIAEAMGRVSTDVSLLCVILFDKMSAETHDEITHLRLILFDWNELSGRTNSSVGVPVSSSH